MWQDVLEDLQARLPRPTFETWLRPTVGMAIETGETDALVVAAQSAFAVEWLERRMFHGLSTALKTAAGKSMELHLRARKPARTEESTQVELCLDQQPKPESTEPSSGGTGGGPDRDGDGIVLAEFGWMAPVVDLLSAEGAAHGVVEGSKELSLGHLCGASGRDLRLTGE